MTQRVDPFDELAALFLTEPEDLDGGGDGTARAAVEMILVGSLPVRAAVWMAPYADAAAREVGPVGLVRLDDESPAVQVVRPDETISGPAGDLAQTIRRIGPRVRRWMIRPALGERGRGIIESGCDQITILSSANEGAIVDAYQRIKLLAEAAEAAGRDLPPIGVAVLGSDQRKAERMHQQLNRTTTTFLDVDVPLVACVQRVEGSMRCTDRWTFAGEPVPSLPAVATWIRESSSPPPAPAPRPEPPPISARAPRPAIKLPPKPAIDVEPKEPARPREPDEHGAPMSLAEFVDGISPIDVRCPGHERLELAVDESGRLHVLAHDDQLRELHVVESWAKAHGELIARACADHVIDPVARAVRHVVTDRPASVADLHGSDLRLHVLAQVIVDGKCGWYAAPLNGQ